jgi:hypothetical protein
MMARENGESYKTDASVLHETITATVKALGEGRIKPEELPIKTLQGQRSDSIRIAPSFSVAKYRAGTELPLGSYTVDALAKFLGETDKRGEAHQAFRTTFAALELISEGYLNESAIKGIGFAL